MRRIRSLMLAVVTAGTLTAGVAPSDAVVGGGLASPGEYPWMAAAYTLNPTSQFCGGTLVKPTVVITAAHCILGLEAPGVTGVLLGRNTLNGTGGEQIPVVAVVINPQWNYLSNTYDIAALKLSRASVQQPLDWAKPGSDAYFAAGVTATVTGWGATSEGGSGSNALKEAQVPIVSDATCSANYGGGITPAQHICAGYPQGGTDTCQGDSGGPLMVPGPGGAFILAGITSFGDGCARANKPGVYSQVATLSSFVDLVTTGA